MATGSNSLLIGVHQFILHPILVLRAWVKLFGLPNLGELVCIVIHDWGYWGCHDMDAWEGERHPEWGARVALKLLGRRYGELCLYHSRHYARRAFKPPSRLCWADKMSLLLEPWWTYLPRAWLSGELREYREHSANPGTCPLYCTHREWHRWVSEKMALLVETRDGGAVPYWCDHRLRKGA